VIAILLLFSLFGEASDPVLPDDALSAWMFGVGADHLAGRPLRRANAALPVMSQGLFVTIVHKGRVRGCFGSFYHRTTDIESLLGEYLCGALRSDPRYEPVTASELAVSDIIITFAESPGEPCPIERIDPVLEGVLIEQDAGGGVVIVPAEFKSLAALKRRAAGAKVRPFRARTLRLIPPPALRLPE
jgi:hypothetical protein